MSYYLIAFLAAAALDAMPAFAPPSWSVLVYLQIRYGLAVAPVILAGICGVTVGKLILTSYIHKASSLILSRHEAHNIEYLGTVMSQSPRRVFVFIFFYCLTPLATSPIFMAAGIAGIKRRAILPPFCLGKLISYTLIILAGAHSAGNIGEMIHGKFSLKGALVPLAGVLMIVGMLFIDWRALLHDKQFRLTIKVFRFKPKEPAQHHHLRHLRRPDQPFPC